MKSGAIISLLCIAVYAPFLRAVTADPDNVCTGFEYRGVATVKLGDYLSMRFLEAGGFFEARNEKRFNEKPLPNHNWRGFFFLYAAITTTGNEDKNVCLNIGYEHESAHPTMGIQVSTADPYEKIYDGAYRVVDLNSLLLRYHRARYFGCNTVTAKIDYQFYFYAKNTPELPGNVRAASNGISVGLEYNRRINEYMSVSLSLFDRYIFRGRKEIAGAVYTGNDTLTRRYPVINEVNTVAGTAGVFLELDKIKRRVAIYGSVLYGNIFGFVDSREQRLKAGGGVCIGR